MVTPNELNALIGNHPKLFHMAERGSWQSIQQHGLLSTTALLDLYEYSGTVRDKIESSRRPGSVRIEHRKFGTAIIRDQKPMTDGGLRRALQDNLSPEEWYQILNKRVFFWLTQERLERLLNAGPYRDLSHDVLVVSTRPLVHDYRESITLSPINSGATQPYPHPRGLNTFLPISDYPYSEWHAKRRGNDPVVELAVEGGVQNIVDYVERVDEMKGSQQIQVLWEKR